MCVAHRHTSFHYGPVETNFHAQGLRHYKDESEMKIAKFCTAGHPAEPNKKLLQEIFHRDAVF